MAIDFVELMKTWWFWALLVLSILAFIGVLVLLWKGKDQLAKIILSLPYTILASIVLNLMIIPWLISPETSFYGQIGIMAVITSLGYPAIITIAKKFLIPVAAKLLKITFNWD